MKMLLVLVQLCFFSHTTSANSKSDYYQAIQIERLSGYQLKSELKRLISATHRPQSYGALYKIYLKSDLDQTYENDGSILDIYSERVKGSEQYNYSKPSDLCGSYRGEGDCLNREHLFPQSVFQKKFPMKADFFHIFPTDGYVNNKRGHLPFGEVKNPNWVSSNGSKVGHNSIGTFRGMVFEPIDEFKGDVARALLYFAIRYEDRVRSWNHEMLNGTSDQVYTKWFLKILLKWNKQDPVSKHEITRNEWGHKFQGNRNPLIDFPSFTSMIWKTSELK
jgi:endonuclease I